VKARKPKAEADRRTVLQQVLFSPTEWAAVEAKLAGRSFPKVIRALLLGGDLPAPSYRPARKVVVRHCTEFEAERLRLLGNFTSNLNQIAKAANSTPRLIPSLLPALVELDRAVRRAIPPDTKP
jgi:hypothetical protein